MVGVICTVEKKQNYVVTVLLGQLPKGWRKKNNIKSKFYLTKKQQTVYIQTSQVEVAFKQKWFLFWILLDKFVYLVLSLLKFWQG